MKSVYFDLLWYYRAVAFPETIYNVQVIPKMDMAHIPWEYSLKFENI